MANVSSMKELSRVAKEWTDSEENRDMIPVFLDHGSGMHYAPSKKVNSFRMGELTAPAGLFKEELRGDLRTVRNLTIRVLAFIPRELASDEVIKIAEKKDITEAQGK